MTFGALQFIFCLIIINILSNKTFSKYNNKVARLLDTYNKNTLRESQIKMMQGERCMWLEMRLDFKYKQYLENHNHNQTSWEQIVALNNEILLKASEQTTANKNLLGSKTVS